MEKWSAWVDGREISYQNDRPWPYWLPIILLAVVAGVLVGVLVWWIWR